jgi:hypothetical protein
MTPARFRKLALALDGVVERPHMDRVAFRTSRKIFATLGADQRVNMIVNPADRREALIESFPETFFSLGGWTRLGYVGIALRKVDETLLRELLTDAWRDALKRTTRRANRDTTDDEEGPPEWERFKEALPSDRFVALADVATRLRGTPTRWSAKKVQRIYDELVSEKELLTKAGGLVALNNALNRGEP